MGVSSWILIYVFFFASYVEFYNSCYSFSFDLKAQQELRNRGSFWIWKFMCRPLTQILYVCEIPTHSPENRKTKHSYVQKRKMFACHQSLFIGIQERHLFATPFASKYKSF